MVRSQVVPILAALAVAGCSLSQEGLVPDSGGSGLDGSVGDGPLVDDVARDGGLDSRHDSRGPRPDAGDSSPTDSTSDVSKDTGPPPTFTLSLSVSGLSGAGLSASDTVDSISPASDGIIAFPTALVAGTYSVTITGEPTSPGQRCAFSGDVTTTLAKLTSSSLTLDVACTSCSSGCEDGTGCTINPNCASGKCTGGLCAPPPCAPTCNDYNACGANGDCASGVCTIGSCQPPACTGSCPDGNVCGANFDCASTVCMGGICKPPACSPSCNDYTLCGANADCASNVCTSGSCQPPACAPTCPDGNVCGQNADCGSTACMAGKCKPPGCSPTCSPGSHCGSNGDCSSGACSSGYCT